MKYVKQYWLVMDQSRIAVREDGRVIYSFHEDDKQHDVDITDDELGKILLRKA